MAVAAFFPWLGSVHLFDWDEINFAEAAREMLVTHNYAQVQINFEPFYEKPPLFFWLQAISMKIWGINEFAARFPNAVFGVLTLATLYKIGRAIQNAKFGFLCALMHMSALLPHFYFKTGIIDPVFNYFIFLGIYSLTHILYLPTARKAVYWAFLGGLAMGLAILTKGPVALLIPGITFFVYWAIARFKPIFSLINLIAACLAAGFIPLIWLAYETYQHGPDFILAFLQYQLELFTKPVAGHGQPFYYHFVVILLGCFPASILAWGKLSKANPTSFTFLRVMQILLGVVMLLFSLVTTKIVHYSSMAYFPLTFLAANYLYDLEQKRIQPNRSMRLGFLWTGMIVVSLFISFPLLGLLKNHWHHLIPDDFTQAMVAMSVPWSLTDCLVGVVYGLLLIVAYRLFRRQAIIPFALLTSLATTFCLTLGTLLIIPKIEAHIQRPAIEFYKQLAGQDVYLTTLGFKSYAPFFYFQQPNDPQSRRKDPHWLLTGEIDKPAYFVEKITDKALLDDWPDIKLIKIEGGFAFYKREIGGRLVTNHSQTHEGGYKK
jgi:4-amino-4-deoxy-L-arabinose transferase-like glycosyltransferase